MQGDGCDDRGKTKFERNSYAVAKCSGILIFKSFVLVLIYFTLNV